MLGRETWVSDHLTCHIPGHKCSVHESVEELVECMRAAHNMFCEKQWQVQREKFKKPLLYQVGDWVWLAN